MSDPQVHQDRRQRYTLTRASIVVAVGVFATALAQPGMLARLPFTLLLRQRFDMGPSGVAAFFFVVTIPWSLKPLAGLLSDSFPILGTRRRFYLVLSGVGASAIWFALLVLRQGYVPLLLGCFLVNVFLVLGSSVSGAVLVEAGRDLGATGRLTSLRVLVQNFVGLTIGPLSGKLTKAPFWLGAAVNALIALLVLPTAAAVVEEPRPQSKFKENLASATTEIRSIMSSRSFLAAAMLMILFYFAPGFSTPMIFRQQDEFGLSMVSIGYLGSIGSLAGIGAGLAYAVLCRKVSMRHLLWFGVVANAIGNFAYLFYSKDFRIDAMIEAQNGALYTMCELGFFHLAAKETPAGSEGLAYGLLISVRNSAMLGADVIGSKMIERHWPFWELIAINSGTTLLVLVLVQFLPRQFLTTHEESIATAT